MSDDSHTYSLNSEAVKDSYKFRLEILTGMEQMRSAQALTNTKMETLKETQEQHHRNVEDIYNRLNAVEQHPGSCPWPEELRKVKGKIGDENGNPSINTRVTELEISYGKQKATVLRTAAENDTWRKEFWIPILRWLVIGALLTGILLAGMHFQDLRGESAPSTTQLLP